MDLVTLLKLYVAGKRVIRGAKFAHQQGKSLWDTYRHSGKDRVGSVRMRDSQRRLWKVRVRSTGIRGQYLKITPKGHPAHEIRASATGYKPEKYLAISPDEWTAFALFAEGDKDWSGRTEDEDLHRLVREILDRLVSSGGAIVEWDDDGEGDDD